MSTTEKLQIFPAEKSYLVRALYLLQSSNDCNCLTDEDIRQAAMYFDVEQTQIMAVIQYYKAFSVVPRAKNTILVCNSDICTSRNETSILDAIQNELKIQIGETTPDNLFTLQSQSCLGKCYDAPLVSINGEIFGELTESMVINLLGKYKHN